MPSPHRLALKQLNATYQDQQRWAIEAFELAAEGGSALGVIGHNGSGKSTLAHAIIGIIPHLIPGRVNGQATLDGCELLTMDFQNRLANVGYTFQDVESQILFGTVRDVLGISCGGTPHSLLRQAIGILNIAPLLCKSPEELSGGEAQRVALLTALRCRPTLLLYDEATSALDPGARRDFGKPVNFLKENDLIVILFGQRRSILAPYCDEMIGLRAGRKVSVTEAIPASIQPPEIFWKDIYDILGSVATHVPKLWCSDVFVTRRGTDSFVLGPINLTVEPGEVVAVLGPNGSGKTTLFLSLIGAIKTQRGAFGLDGKAFNPRQWRAAAPSASIVTQSPLSRIIGSTLKEEFALSLECYQETLRNEVINRIRTHFPFLEMDRDPLQLSFGQQRVLTMLTSLLDSHPLIFLDEPEQGLDPLALCYLKEWVKGGPVRRNKMVIFSTHDLVLAAELADRCILLNHGHFLAETRIKEPVALESWYFEHLAKED